MPLRPGPFVCGQIALALARVPGRMERDEDEAYRILDHIIASYKRGEFTDDEIMVFFGKPPQIRTLKSLPEDARGEIESLFRPIWRDAVMLSFSAAKRYLEASTLAGAPRLLFDWFTDNTSPRSSHRAIRDRPSAAAGDSGDALASVTSVAPLLPLAGKKGPIPNPILVKHLLGMRAEGGSIPGADNLFREVVAAFPEYHVTRQDVRAVHKTVWGELPPGRRKKCSKLITPNGTTA
jgi:hypothetical protein